MTEFSSDLDLFVKAVNRVHARKMRVLMKEDDGVTEFEMFKIEGDTSDGTLRLVYRSNLCKDQPQVFYRITEDHLNILGDFLNSIRHQRAVSDE